MKINKATLRVAFRDTLPILAGYLFLGFGFGILLQQSGYGPLWAIGMATTMYSGSMQYLGVPLMATGASLLTAAITTLLVNARHLFYGISLIDKYKGAGKKKAYMIFGLTDETFSLVSQDRFIPEGADRHTYCFLVTLLDHGYWILGGLLGNLAGLFIPLNYEGIEFVLTALFVTIFVEQWLSTKHHAPALIGMGCTVVCLLIFGADIFLIPTMALITAILLGMPKVGRMLHKEDKPHDK